MKPLPLLMAAAVLFIGSAAHAAAPIVDIKDQPVPDGLTQEQIQSRLVAGVLSRPGWTVQEVTEGRLVAQLSVRSHLASVDVTFSDAAYSITYKDSHNLDYKPKKRKIHANYNKWVGTLNGALQRSLFADPPPDPASRPTDPDATSGQLVPEDRAETQRGSYDGGSVTVPHAIGLASHVSWPKAVSECAIDAQLPRWLAQASPNIQLDDGTSGGNQLDLEITEIHMPGGGAWSGPKWMELTGTLREGNGNPVASFRAKRFSTGGVFGGLKGSCKILERCGKAIAGDVSRWLQNPFDGAELGDAR